MLGRIVTQSGGNNDVSLWIDIGVLDKILLGPKLFNIVSFSYFSIVLDTFYIVFVCTNSYLSHKGLLPSWDQISLKFWRFFFFLFSVSFNFLYAVHRWYTLDNLVLIKQVLLILKVLKSSCAQLAIRYGSSYFYEAFFPVWSTQRLIVDISILFHQF